MGYCPVRSYKMSDLNHDAALSAYKEKKWYKDEDGENITNGYSLRGQVAFKRAVEGLIETLKKGVSTDVAGRDYRVLDARKMELH